MKNHVGGRGVSPLSWYWFNSVLKGEAPLQQGVSPPVKITLTDEVEVVYEKRVTPHGNSAKVDAQKKYIGRRAYVIILKNPYDKG